MAGVIRMTADLFSSQCKLNKITHHTGLAEISLLTKFGQKKNYVAQYRLGQFGLEFGFSVEKCTCLHTLSSIPTPGAVSN